MLKLWMSALEDNFPKNTYGGIVQIFWCFLIKACYHALGCICKLGLICKNFKGLSPGLFFRQQWFYNIEEETLFLWQKLFNWFQITIFRHNLQCTHPFTKSFMSQDIWFYLSLLWGSLFRVLGRGCGLITS